MRTFTYRPAKFTEITASDLQLNAGGDPCRAYLITIQDERGRTSPEMAQAIWFPDEERLGIAWGGDSTWATVGDVERGIEMWLNDPINWEARNC